MRKPHAIIGMSPGNSYFKDYEIRFLLKEAIQRFGVCAIMVADVPAIATYMALGYSENKARSKAIPKGNNLKNRTRRLATELGYSEDQVRIIDWADEVACHPDYLALYQSVEQKYKTIPTFAEDVRATSRDVLVNALTNTGQTEEDMEAAVDQAIHYLLSELAFLEFAPAFLKSHRVCYVYHRNWPVYENYVRGVYDGHVKPYMDFLLLEAPYETYRSLHPYQDCEGDALHDTYSRVMKSGILHASYIDYPPALSRNAAGNMVGVFADIVSGFAQKHNLDVRWVEETGYGAVIDGLRDGRFDIFCSPTWPTPERQRYAALSLPLYYSEVGVWVREDSALVGQDWLNLNNPKYSIAITENDITHAICLTDFTQAKWIRAPQLGRVEALLKMVADGQATATMVEAMTYDAYTPALSYGLVNIAENKPIRRYANSFLVGKNQDDFKGMLDDYLKELLQEGVVRDLLMRYVADLKGVVFPKTD